MEAVKASEAPKMPPMVMCGDHSSFTRAEVASKESRLETDKSKEKFNTSYSRLSPTSSHTRADLSAKGLRAPSEHALRLAEARRRAASLDAIQTGDGLNAPGNRALIQAALGSFHWPPYLLAVWVLVLLLTHILHCIVNMLEKTLPKIRNACQYLRTWVEESWRGPEQQSRLWPALLALATCVLYAGYSALYALHVACVWAVQPLCADADERADVHNVMELVHDDDKRRRE